MRKTLFIAVVVACGLAWAGGQGADAAAAPDVSLHVPTAAEEAAGQPMRLQLKVDCVGQECGMLEAEAVRAAAAPRDGASSLASGDTSMSGAVSKAALAMAAAMAAGVLAGVMTWTLQSVFRPKLVVT
jgi:hypothetical protein